jgi:hypothetical protein
LCSSPLSSQSISDAVVSKSGIAANVSAVIGIVDKNTEHFKGAFVVGTFTENNGNIFEFTPSASSGRRSADGEETGDIQGRPELSEKT